MPVKVSQGQYSCSGVVPVGAGDVAHDGPPEVAPLAVDDPSIRLDYVIRHRMRFAVQQPFYRPALLVPFGDQDRDFEHVRSTYLHPDPNRHFVRRWIICSHRIFVLIAL